MEVKTVLKLELYDDKAKQKALKAVSGLSGINLISMDMEGKKLTVIGEVDPINVVSKLRKLKLWHTEILTVGPAKEPEKKKEEPEKKNPNQQMVDLFNAGREYNYNPHPTTYYHMQSIDENPNTCVIC